MRALIANLKHAARNRETVRIGGGDFNPEELKRAAELLEVTLDLVPLLDRAGVLSLYIANTPERRRLMNKEQARLSERLRTLVELEGGN